MTKKIIYSFVFVFAILMFAANSSEAITTLPKDVEKISVSVEADELEKEETDIIKRISLRNKFKRSPKAQIENFYKKYNRYSEKSDTKKLKEMYSEHFVNNDGFDRDTIFKLMSEASDAYKNVTYTTDILSIDVDELYAVVKVHETATGETTKKIDKVNDYGFIKSDLYYTNYLRKEGGKWKILSAQIESEDISLLYGEAKKANITMSAPRVVPAGVEYDASVKIESPDGCFVVGSIVNEQIKYPQTQPKDVLRAVKSDELARVLKSNTDNHNEYATISLGITRPHVEPPAVVIDMTGMAIVMSRVNVIQKNNVTKIEKEIVDGKTSSEGK